MHLKAVRWLVILMIASGCATVHTALDVQAIEAKAALASSWAGRIDRKPWPFRSGAALDALTRPMAVPVITRLPIGPHHLAEEIIEEQLVFRSRQSLRYLESNYARLYVYRHGELGARPVQLWVPGLYVSELALTLLRPLLLDTLAQGVDVVFFVPPYHLERTPTGLGSGDAVLATTLSDHLGVIAQGVADLRDTVLLLRSRGVKTLGVFAGSMGANFALQVARFDGTPERPAFDFFTAMIPLIDWSALLLERPEFAGVRSQLAAAGSSLDALGALYAELDPSRRSPALPASAISIIAARFDQVTPAAPRVRFEAAWGITRVHLVERGHATMLLSDLPAIAHDLLEADLRNVKGRDSGVERGPSTH